MGMYRTISCAACGGLLIDRHRVGRKESLPCFLICPHCGRAVDFRKTGVEWFLLSHGQRKLRILSTWVSGFCGGFAIALVGSVLINALIDANLDIGISTLLLSIFPTPAIALFTLRSDIRKSLKRLLDDEYVTLLRDLGYISGGEVLAEISRLKSDISSNHSCESGGFTFTEEEMRNCNAVSFDSLVR
jgi:hypothetical protein